MKAAGVLSNHQLPAPSAAGKLCFGCLFLLSKQSRIKRSYVVFVDKFGPLAINFSSDFWASAFCWLLFWDTLYQLVLGISSCSMKAATEQELRYS